MNTEKIEKLKKGLNNSQIPESLKEKIRQQISRLEDEDKANQPVTKAEIEKIEDKIEDAVEVAEKKEEQAEAKKPTTARKPRAKKVVEPKAKTVRKPRAKKVVEPKTTTANKKSAMALAKEIRKPNEKWNEAVKRAGATMRGEVKEATKKVTSELEKLKAFVKRRKELKTIAGTNLLRDSKRKAKPRGSRTVTHSGETSNQYGTFDNKLGRKYSENRENRTDRLAPKYPKNSPYLAGGGGVDGIEEDIDMTDDYVLRVNKGVEPKNRASMREFMAKTNESREAMTYELGGAFMETDLAGNTGGGTGGLNANMPLSGVSGTQYTDLVGETGALSSAEMFDGGGRVKNEELISYETFLITEKNDYDKAIDSLIVQINKSLSKKGMPPITTKIEFDKESEYQERVYVDDNVMIRIWSIKKTPKGYNLEVSVFKEYFAKGGGIRKVGNREYPLGRNWTNDHNQVNKSEEHETSYNRKRSFAGGGGVDSDKHFPLNKNKLDEDAEWYASRIKSGNMTTTKKNLMDAIEEYKKDLFLLEVGRKKPSDIIGTGYKGNTRKLANTWLLEQIYIKEKILKLLENHSFADGGAVMANQQIIDNASQQYVNYYLGEGAVTGMFKDGGAIKNQYAGRTPRDIWNSLSIRQRMHFLHDHEEEILEDKKLRYFTDNDLVELIHSDWFELDDDVKNAFADHTSRGEYATGGLMHNHTEMEDSYARGGGIRTVNGREYSTGRNWTNDHRQHNKGEDYEVPMSKRR
jgi:hypothetical protein